MPSDDTLHSNGPMFVNEIIHSCLMLLVQPRRVEKFQGTASWPVQASISYSSLDQIRSQPCLILLIQPAITSGNIVDLSRWGCSGLYTRSFAAAWGMSRQRCISDSWAWEPRVHSPRRPNVASHWLLQMGLGTVNTIVVKISLRKVVSIPLHLYLYSSPDNSRTYGSSLSSK